MSFTSKCCINILKNGMNFVGRSILLRNSHVMTQANLNCTGSGVIGTIPMPCNQTIVDKVQRLLVPFNTLFNQVAGFKVKGRVRRRCKDCYIVTRQQRLYVICPTHPRHKQMSMKPKPHNTWLLTHATQSKIRPY
ncbi:39S ribosomal protein L36, mitochondrial [Teleopsis dalmanni]|uniref:39S ribosomal protein L36, mitochondrial n=1 Tax=Teleopsis dalmanni TaxID=139649 RepID=UPI0018CEDC20|nr:39S ribosomal protein L36, mitochondrial [Teleopsis dalmanni]